MSIPRIARDFAYQGLQLLVFAPASAMIAKTQTASRFIPTFETVLNLNTWKDKLLEAWNGPEAQAGVQAQAFDWNPISQSNRETVMIATTIALTTTTLFQLLRRAPGFKNSPGTTFALSAGVSFASLYAASAYGIIPANQSDVAEIFKNILVIGTGITASAKLLNLAREQVLGPMLAFADLLSPVSSGSKTDPSRDVASSSSRTRRRDSTPVTKERGGIPSSRRYEQETQEVRKKRAPSKTDFSPIEEEYSTDEELSAPVTKERGGISSSRRHKHESHVVSEKKDPKKIASPTFDEESSSGEDSPPTVRKEHRGSSRSRRSEQKIQVLKEKSASIVNEGSSSGEEFSPPVRRKKTSVQPISSETLPSPSKLEDKGSEGKSPKKKSESPQLVAPSTSEPPKNSGSGNIDKTDEF